MSSVYPRVLVLTASSLNACSATGITLLSLFDGWPRDKLGQVFDDDIPPDQGQCGQAIRLELSRQPIVGLMKSLETVARQISRRSVPWLVPGSEPSQVASSLPFAGRPRRMAMLADLIPLSLPQHIEEWLREYRPQVIYALPVGIRWTTLTLTLSRELNIPYVLHFMDDWPSTFYQETTLAASWARRKLGNHLRDTIQHADVTCTIGEAMATEYATRYNRPFQTYMRCVGVAPSPPPARCDRKGNISFVYVGGLHLDRWKSLCEIGSAISGCSEINSRLVVYCPDEDRARYGSAFQSIPCVDLRRPLPPNQVSSAIKEHDVVVHVESFDPLMTKYTQLSVSTKLPEYLASGRPILAYGPSELASIQYVRSAEAGIVVDSKNTQQLSESIRVLIEDEGLRRTLGWNGYRTAGSRHDSRVVKSRFQSMVSRLSTRA